MKKIVFSILLTLTSFNSIAADFVSCEREASSFRQFCAINEDSTTSSLSVSSDAVSQGTPIDIMPVLRTGELTLNDLNSSRVMYLDLPGLSPYVSATIDFTNNSYCHRSDLWLNNIYLAVQASNGHKLNLSKVRYGLYAYRDQLFINESFMPWSIEQTGSTITLSSQVYLNNSDHYSDTPKAKQRIPRSCQMEVQNLALEFGELPLYSDLNNLYVQASTTIALMTRASVLHAHLVDGQRGSICSVDDLSTRLLDIEFAWTWDDLSFLSQDAIVAGMMEAESMGAINVPGGDHWQFFKTGFQSIASTECGGMPSESYEVSIDPFIAGGSVIHHQGYNNALQYQEARQNLNQLLAGAWAVNNVAMSAIANYQQEEWLTSSIILDQL